MAIQFCKSIKYRIHLSNLGLPYLELFSIAWSSPGFFFKRNLSRFIQHLSGQVEKRISRQIVDRGGIDRESDVKKISRCLSSGFKLLHEVCLYKVLLQFFKNKLEKTCKYFGQIYRELSESQERSLSSLMASKATACVNLIIAFFT